MQNRETTAPLLVSKIPHAGGGGGGNMSEFEVAEKNRRFVSSLCECCGDCKTFWFSFFCPCFQYGRNVNAFGHPPVFDSTEVGFNAFVYLFMDCTCCFGIVMSTVLRGDVRDKYGIKGNVIGDFCANLFCRPCSLAQVAREIEANKKTEEQDVCLKYPPAAQQM